MSPPRRMWTAEEDAILRRLYKRGRVDEALAALPGRTRRGLLQRAHKLKISFKPHWTKAEDTKLVFLWESGLGLRNIAARVGRTMCSAHSRAMLLGLPSGVPDGFESFNAAAERVGYTTHTLRRILEAAGVKFHSFLANPWLRRRKNAARRHFVDPIRVDAAVKDWLSRETPEVAARRIGTITGDALRRRLRLLGEIGPIKPGLKPPLRLPVHAMERAAALTNIEVRRLAREART